MNQRRAVLGRLGLGALGLLTASCGGGGVGALADVGSGGTGSTTIGPVSGFGSVIVNGLRYDDSAAVITDDSGATVAASALGLGMLVRVDGTLSDASNGRAATIRVTSQLLGPLSAIDLAAGTLALLGQGVKLTATTVFAGVADAAGLVVGDTVEVWGALDPANATVTASRVERKTASGAFKLMGAVTAVNSGARSCTIGALTVRYAGTSFATGAVEIGDLVRVRAVLAPAAGVLVATEVEDVDAFGGDPGDAPTAKNGHQLGVEGVVSGRVTGSALFRVGNVAVDASGAVFSGGTLAALANGDRIEVSGPVTAGVLVATQVEVKVDRDREAQEFELHGPITRFTSRASFVVRGVTVDASGSSVVFGGGTAADLKLGAVVEVHGLIEGGANGSVLMATAIGFGG